MKKLLTPFLLFLGIIAGSGCQKPAPPTVKFSLNRPFPLLVGQTAECADVLGFTIRFDKIASDSRCPQGVECITAGKADVVLTIGKTGESQTFTLPFTLPNGTSNVTDYKGHTVRVMGVAPIKYKDKEIKPEDYSIVLTVMETPPMAKLGEAFALAVGERILVEEDKNYSIRFDSVVGDSRCPEAMQCIWAGRADCVYTLGIGDSTQHVTLITGDMSKGGKGETMFGPYTLKLTSIAPNRKNGVVIPQEKYITSLILTK